MKYCPCGLPQSYDECCGIFIKGTAQAPNPEALMRSRYTAYTKANIDYIIRTMKSPASDGYDSVSSRRWAKSVVWIKLDVLYVQQLSPTIATVEFCAYFYVKDEKQMIHEISTFALERERWYYASGLQPTN